ncbi:MAG: GIY-YIG nuclease family protein [Candidatus Paceibacterota bacterium]
MHYVYLLLSIKDNNWYTGYTNNLKKRILDHNSGKVESTKSRTPFKLIYYESCSNMLDARARERFLKTGPGKTYLKKRLKYFLSEN